MAWAGYRHWGGHWAQRASTAIVLWLCAARRRVRWDGWWSSSLWDSGHVREGCVSSLTRASAFLLFSPFLFCTIHRPKRRHFYTTTLLHASSTHPVYTESGGRWLTTRPFHGVDDEAPPIDRFELPLWNNAAAGDEVELPVEL